MLSQRILAKAFHAVSQVTPSPFAAILLSTCQLRVVVGAPAFILDRGCAPAVSAANAGPEPIPRRTKIDCRPMPTRHLRRSMGICYALPSHICQRNHGSVSSVGFTEPPHSPACPTTGADTSSRMPIELRDRNSTPQGQRRQRRGKCKPATEHRYIL